MKEESEHSTKSNRARGNKDGEKRSLSLLFSCFSSSDDDDADVERSSKDEVLKPLYYIVGDINSEQMEQTVQSMDDESIDKKARANKTVQSIDGESIDKKGRAGKTFLLADFLSRWFRGRRGKSRKTDNVGLATRMNETESDDGTSNGRPTKKKLLKKSFTHRILRLPAFLHFSKRNKKHDSQAMNITQSISEEVEEKTESGDTSSVLQPSALGVTFAHPAYTGKCHFLTEAARLDTTNHLWTQMKTNQVDDRKVDDDDYTLPPTKTIVETTTAETWGSFDSASFYPTDEQSREGSVYYGSFDSDIDIPFDEIFTEASFFDI